MFTKQFVRTQAQTKAQDVRKQNYASNLTLGLILFAQSNPEFAKKLENLITALPDRGEYDPRPLINEEVEILVPGNYCAAISRTKWLFQKITLGQIGTVDSIRILKTWAKTKPWDSPKQIIIGLAIGVIPGLTAGHLSRKETLSVVVRDDLIQQLDLKLSNQITQASLAVLTQALESAGGQIRDLEPEVAAWVVDDQSLSYFSAPLNKLTEIQKTLAGLEIVHSEMKDDDGPKLIAISPSVNLVVLQRNWDLLPLKF